MSQLRRTLARSHVAAVALCLLLFWSFDALYEALANRVEAVAIYFMLWIGDGQRPPIGNYAENINRYMVTLMPHDLSHLMYASFYLVTAVALSLWVFDTTPFHALRNFPNHVNNKEQQ